MGSLYVTATTQPRPTKSRPASVNATILPQVIVHLSKDPFFENAWIDDVSISSGMDASTANPRSATLLQLPSYRRATNTLMAMMGTLLPSPESTIGHLIRASIILYQRAADTIVSTSLLYIVSAVRRYVGDLLVREWMSCRGPLYRRPADTDSRNSSWLLDCLCQSADTSPAPADISCSRESP